jgi:peptidoglycan/xylan/chitin deacetylase (PgdA/CDA1 family)
MPVALLLHDVLNDGAEWRESGFAGADADLYKFSLSEFMRILDAICVAEPTIRTSTVMAVDVVDGPTVMLTFDDGGSGSILAADALERRGWRGHFFIPTAFVGQPSFASAADLRQLHERGHVVGSHSHTHPQRISALGARELDEEWHRSVRQLEGILGTEVTCGSIPGGFYSRAVVESSGRAGISRLFTSEPRRDPWRVGQVMAYGRFSVQRSTTTAEIVRLARGRASTILLRGATWNAKKVVKTLGGDAWLSLRRSLLARFGPRRFE